MTDDERSLRLAVAANPEEQAPRDMLRDLWDAEGQVKCPECKGAGVTVSRWRIPEMDDGDYGTSTTSCPRCRSTGYVPRPRVEFVRVQEELFARGYPSPNDERTHELAVRERALLAAHERAFRCVPCDVCAFLKPGASLRQDCPACDGRGDVGGLERLRVPENSGDSIYRHAVTWERGHVVAVRCELGEVMERVAGNKHGEMDIVSWQPTPWALSVVRWHPVVRFEVTDREPEQMHGGWAWWDDGIDTGPASVPRVLLAEPSWNTDLALIHGQREAALNLLYTRLAEFVRGWKP